MRHSDIIIPQRWFITEAKARIDHPEDLAFEEGSAGAKRALNALTQAAEQPHTVTIKWDGSPALIFGRDADGFTVTDKSGFGSKKPGGMPRSAADLDAMLFMRKPDEPGRQAYAKSIAGLYSMLERAMPADTQGYLEGDLLWTKTPEIIDGHFVFKPNKITYRIPVDSPLGKRIGNSRAGIAVHSRFDSKQDDEPRAIGTLESSGLREPPGLVIMGPEIRDLESTALPEKSVSILRSFINSNSASIDRFLDPAGLAARQLTNLPDLMKKYVNSRAYAGTQGLSDAANGFLTWAKSNTKDITDRKRENLLSWIAENPKGYGATWMVADQLTKLKDVLKHSVDTQVGGTVRADLRDVPGHEGYVADTPSGKIKLVNRPHFMRKEPT
jgi:Family of unknown function (DUF6267)